MKKHIVAASMLLIAGSAFASSINVPFFLDWVDIGVRGFIGIKNNTNEALVLSVFYRDGTGQNRTPGTILGNEGADFVTNQGDPVPAGSYNSDPTNTFTLGPNASIAWRPAAKGPGSGDGAGDIVPKMMGYQVFQGGAFVAGQGEFPPFNGSVEIRWETVNGPTDVQGRYTQDAGGAAAAQSSYLLPPGTATQ